MCAIILEVGCERNIMKKEISELVQYVKDWANFHYNDGGWDVIVECWEDKDILKVLKESNATTEKEAIDSFKDVVAVWAERQADADFHRREALGEDKGIGYDQFTSWRGDSNGSVGVD
jgi:hypothetical protein